MQPIPLRHDNANLVNMLSCTIKNEWTPLCLGSDQCSKIFKECIICLRECGHISHYSDVTMGAIAFQITSITIVYTTVYSGADQRKHQKPRVTGLCEGNSPLTGEFPPQRASNAENVSIWWRHHGVVLWFVVVIWSFQQRAVISTLCAQVTLYGDIGLGQNGGY